MKTTIAHSPGPWRLGVRQPTSDKFIYGSRGEEIADCDRKTNFADENLANARLIAAAPSLLEALRAVVAALSQPVQSTDLSEADLRRLHGAVLILRGDARFAIETATAAIAKATA